MPDRRPHVLYVAWGFPPCRAGGVYRALATANAFAEQGFAVTVLTAARESFLRFTGVDLSLEDRVHPDIQVIRIPFEWPALESDVRRWTAARVFAPKLWRRWRNREDQKTFPELGYGPWRADLEQAAQDIHAGSPVDLVVATANPNVDFMAAKVLHERHGVPYVMDYRDAWMLDVFDGGLLHDTRGRVDHLERALLADAHEVWFVNEPIRRWHQERHPEAADRMFVVANGYDPELAPEPRLVPPPPGTPLTFGYIGTVSPKVPLEEFADGWRLARRRGGAMEGARAHLRGYLGYYSTPSPILLEIVESYADDGLDYLGPIPKAEVRHTYAAMDVCLLLLGAGRYVTSGKVYEYLATALPIVSVHDPGNAATEVLRAYPLWFPVADLSPRSVAAALEAAADAARTASTEVREACREFSLGYAREFQLRPRVEALRDDLVAGDHGGRCRVRIMLLDSGRGNHGGQVVSLRDELGLEPEDTVVWIAWRPPKEPLPVEHHLVLGPSPLHIGRPRRAETAAGPDPADDIHAADMRDESLGRRPDSADLPEDQLEGQLPESSQPHHHISHDGEGRATAARRALADPRQLIITSRRRAREASEYMREFAIRGTASVKRRLVKSEQRPVQMLVSTAQVVFPGINEWFGLAARRTPAVLDLAARSDVILCHDSHSQVAAWLIGRRVPGPDIVVGIAAARRVINERRG